MALSKPLRINKILDKNEPISIDHQKIRDVCYVSYKNAVSIEVITHLLGGENMDYYAMELEDSFQCYDYCYRHILENIQKEKHEITFFEDRKNSTSNVLIAVVIQPKTKTKREHVVFMSAVRMTVMVQPRVGFVRFFRFTGKSCFHCLCLIYEKLSLKLDDILTTKL